jgi:hypothetical protein
MTKGVTSTKSFFPSFLVMLLTALFIQLAGAQLVPVFQYAIFYSMDLEIGPGAAMTVIGHVHANGNIWATGNSPSQPLTFSSYVDASGFYTNSRSPNDPQSWSPGNVIFNIPNNPLQKVGLITVPTDTNNPAGTKAFLDLPPANLMAPNAAAYSPTGSVYFYNAADLIITNTSTGTNWTVLYDNGNDYITPIRTVLPDVVFFTTNGVTHIVTTNSYYSFVTNATFYDYRESDTVQAIQIDVGKFNKWLTNVSFINGTDRGGSQYNQLNTTGSTSKGHNINSIYVYNSVPLTSTTLPAVRLVNGSQLPSTTLFGNGLTAGLTVATAQPIYTLGNYNVTNAGATAFTLGSTTNGGCVPAALFGDALTVLSSAWQDSWNSSTFLGNRTPVQTTLNAACLQGIVPSYSDSNGIQHFSGGVENFFRMSENWNNSINLTYNGSIVVLFPSQYATNIWQGPGIYYNPPARLWGFDVNFLNGSNYLPPLTPLLLDTNPPLIIVQPQSQTNNAGSNMVFSVSASAGTGFGVIYYDANPNLLNYQWSLNGTEISGATNTTLVLTNIQPWQAGNYTLQVTNCNGSTTSSNAVLTVIGQPPTITTQPTNVVALAGGSAIFTVAAAGTAPLSCQWVFNNTNLEEATNLTLTLSNLTTDQTGAYSITVTNLAGSVTSSNAILSVYSSAVPTLSGSAFDVDNNFSFTVAGVPGFNYVVQTSTNLVDWMPVMTNISPFSFTDTNAAGFQQQFYRSIYSP